MHTLADVRRSFCVCVLACMHMCVLACVRVCLRVCMCAYACVCALPTDCMCVLQHCICQSLISHRLLPPDYQHYTFHHLSCTVPRNESALAGPLCCLHDGITVHACV